MNTSDKWDYESQQFELLGKFFIIKYKEAFEMHLKKHNKTLEKITSYHEICHPKLFPERHAETRQMMLEAEDQIKMIKDEINKADEIIKKIVTEDELSKWANSMTCIGCMASFLNYEHLLTHMRTVHFVKMEMWKRRTEN